MAREILKRKGQKFDAYYSVIMPDTWTPIFNLTNKERVERWLNDGKAQLKTVIENIKLKRGGDFTKKNYQSLWQHYRQHLCMLQKETQRIYL